MLGKIMDISPDEQPIPLSSQHCNAHPPPLVHSPHQFGLASTRVMNLMALGLSASEATIWNAWHLHSPFPSAD